jgi:hypothetical protein
MEPDDIEPDVQGKIHRKMRVHVRGAFMAGVPGRWQGLVNVDLGLLSAWAASALVFVVVSLITSRRRLPTRL